MAPQKMFLRSLHKKQMLSFNTFQRLTYRMVSPKAKRASGWWKKWKKVSATWEMLSMRQRRKKSDLRHFLWKKMRRKNNTHWIKLHLWDWRNIDKSNTWTVFQSDIIQIYHKVLCIIFWESIRYWKRNLPLLYSH